MYNFISPRWKVGERREMMKGKDAHELCLQVEVIQEVSSSKIASAETVTLTMHSSEAFNRRNNYSRGSFQPLLMARPWTNRVSARTENITITFLLVATDILHLLLLASKRYKAIFFPTYLKFNPFFPFLYEIYTKISIATFFSFNTFSYHLHLFIIANYRNMIRETIQTPWN